MSDEIYYKIEELKNKDDLDFYEIYEELLKDDKLYDMDDVLFVFSYEYDINIDKLKREDKKFNEIEERCYQNVLRKKLLDKYKCCMITNEKINIFLEVAHIKPVSECINYEEKSDINNTLLLSIYMHKLFDMYIFTICPETHKIIVSNKEKNKNVKECLKEYVNKMINMDDRSNRYLEYHYNKFIKNELMN